MGLWFVVCGCVAMELRLASLAFHDMIVVMRCHWVVITLSFGFHCYFLDFHKVLIKFVSSSHQVAVKFSGDFHEVII